MSAAQYKELKDWLIRHEKRIREMEITQAVSTTKMTLIVAGASIFGSGAVAVVGGVILWWISKA